MSGEERGVGDLKIGDVFSLIPIVQTDLNGDPIGPETWTRYRCTGIMPVSGQHRARPSRGNRDEYSVYFKLVDGGAMMAKRFPWNAKIYLWHA